MTGLVCWRRSHRKSVCICETYHVYCKGGSLNADRAECRRAQCRPQPGGMPTRAECRPGAMPNTPIARY